MELNERLDKELERRFEDLENLKTGSDEQGKATDNIVKLYKLRMDENEQENSKNADEDKAVLERHKLELEEQKAKDDKLIRILTTVTSVGVTTRALLWAVTGTARASSSRRREPFVRARSRV